LTFVNIIYRQHYIPTVAFKKEIWLKPDVNLTVTIFDRYYFVCKIDEVIVLVIYSKIVLKINPVCLYFKLLLKKEFFKIFDCGIGLV
jgi:hypothetical protein